MSYERVSTPAFWIDYLQYLKAIGVSPGTTWAWMNSGGDDGTGRIGLWDMKPSKMVDYVAYAEASGMSTAQHFGMAMMSNDKWITAPTNFKLQLARFYNTANFAGALGHNLYSAPSATTENPGWRTYLPYFSGAYYEPEDAYPGQYEGQADGAYNKLLHATDGSDKVYGGEWANEGDAGNAYIMPTSDGYILADYSGGLHRVPEAQYEDTYFTYPDADDPWWEGLDYTDTEIEALAGTSLKRATFGYETIQSIRPKIATADGEVMGEDDTFKMGCLVLGRKFTMPTAPNMSLTQEYLFDGTKTQTSRGGATLTNTLWHSPPNWGDLPAWGRSDTGNPSLGGYSGILNQRNFLSGRRGRRTWNLKFAFLSEDNVFPEYILRSDGTDFHDMSGITNLATNLHSASDTLYGILSLTLGGAIPFVFQPDKDEDNFAMVRFDQKSIKLKQSSHRTYDFSCKLEEVW